MLSVALAGLRARRSRTLLAAVGIVAASLVVGTATTVGYGLATGFDRAATAADLPDVIARFSPTRPARIDERVAALPNLAARSYRYEQTNTELEWRRHEIFSGALHVILGGRRGYHIVAGHDLSGARAEVVIERGLAREWGLRPGDRLDVGRFGAMRVAGVAVSPDNVAYPLARAARVYVDVRYLARRYGFDPARVPANVALLWLHDPAKADVTLTQARAVSFGIGRLELITRAGVRVLLDEAAGIVISLLVAFSLVALAAAGTMLAAGAHADVQRRLPALAVQRAVGATPRGIAGLQALEALMVAVPAALLGIAIGALAVTGPAANLLAALNELAPGAALLGPLAAALAAVVAVVVAAATWPAWRAARRPPAAILRGGDLATGGAPGRGAQGGLLGLGARFATAATGRWLATVATLAVCAGVICLMLSLASLLQRLRDDPGTVGKRYSVLAAADETALPAIRRIPGVASAAARYEVDAADAFRLGEPVRVVAYRGDHTPFEAPPLAAGRRVRGPGEVEVGAALADALGLRPGSTFAALLPNASEVRFRVSGVVRALERNGNIAWVQADRLLDADPNLDSALAIRLGPRADRTLVERRLREYGAVPQSVGGAQTRSGAFLGVLAAVLRGVGLAVGLVCLYALVQALAVTARERRGAIALLRAAGADARALALVLAGAAAAVVVPGALAGIALGALVFGPLVGRLAAGFADLAIMPTVAQAALVGGGLVALAAAATGLVARRVLQEPVVSGLRED